MPGAHDAAGARLARIAALVSEALALADEGNDHVIGAKLSESLIHVQARIDGIDGRREGKA